MFQKALVFLLKSLVTGGILVYLASQIKREAFAGLSENFDITPLFFGLLAFLLTLPLAAWRSYWVLQKMGYNLSFSFIFQSYWRGLAYSQFLPGSIGGDVARIAELKAQGVPLKKGALALLLERGTGLLSLIGLVLLGTLLWTDNIWQNEILSNFIKLLALCTLCGGVGSLMLFLLKSRLPEILKKITDLMEETIRIFAPSFFTFGVHVSAATLIHVGAVILCFCCVLSVGGNPDIFPLSALFPLVLLLMVLPISLGGWGVREGVAVLALAETSLITHEQALASMLLFGVMLLLISFPGALMILNFKVLKK